MLRFGILCHGCVTALYDKVMESLGLERTLKIISLQSPFCPPWGISPGHRGFLGASTWPGHVEFLSINTLRSFSSIHAPPAYSCAWDCPGPGAGHWHGFLEDLFHGLAQHRGETDLPVPPTPSSFPFLQMGVLFPLFQSGECHWIATTSQILFICIIYSLFPLINRIYSKAMCMCT